MQRTTLVLTAFVTLAATPSRAADAPLDRATLRGLKSLNVVVDLAAELQQAGIARDALATRVRQRLEKGGIPLDVKSHDFIGLKITAAHSRNTSYAVCLELGVYQSVTLKRDPSVITNTLTWSGESVLLLPPKPAQEILTNTVDQLVDQFVSAFRGVNPAPATPSQQP